MTAGREGCKGIDIERQAERKRGDRGVQIAEKRSRQKGERV